MPFRFSPAFLKERRPAHRLHFSSPIRPSVLQITVRLPTATAPGMRIIPMIRSMASVITAAVAALSGRETIGRVAAGAIASKILNEMGIHILAYTRSIGPVTISMDQFNEEAVRNTATCMPDYSADEQALTYLQECMHRQDSAGGVIECQVTGVPAGIGDPVFEKLDANLSKAVMSIGAVKAVEIGDGIAVSKSCGSENNDHFEILDGRIVKKTNHAGGILGGISDGSTIVLRAHVKPTPSIFSEQDTVNNQREEIKIAIRGRHDPVIVPRAVVVVESMIAITLLDEMMKNMSSRLNDLKTYYAILKDESC